MQVKKNMVQQSLYIKAYLRDVIFLFNQKYTHDPKPLDSILKQNPQDPIE